MDIKLAVDVMGGDFKSLSTLQGVQLLLERHTGVKTHLFGPLSIIENWKKHLHESVQDRIFIHHTEQYIDNDTSPRDALRKFPNSSMKLSIEALKSGLADACISSGNTGALVALSTLILRTLENVSRPAIAKSLPTFNLQTAQATGKNVVMLDLGANVDPHEKNLFDNALLGNALYQSLYHKQPNIRLLNIGLEDIKGSLLIKNVHKNLQELKHYQGFIEPDTMLSGNCDVIVTDGFSGNIALKSSEGIAKIFRKKIKRTFTKNIMTKFAASLVQSSLKEELESLSPKQYNGACVLGLKGIIVKSHGNSDGLSFYYALLSAMRLVQNDLLEKIERLSH